MARRPAGRSFTDTVLGDLLEERRRRAARSRARAAIWFWTQALTIAAYLAVRSVGAAARAALFLPRRAAGGGRELRHAIRALRQAPWYSLAVVAVLTLGMVLATTVFAVVDGVLFKSLPYPRSAELVAIRAGFQAVNNSFGHRGISTVDVNAWAHAMPDVAFTAFRTSSSARFEETNDAPFGVAEVEPHFFDVVGVPPLMGGFSPDHFAETSRAGATIISHHLWQTRFGGAPDIVGQRIVRGTASMEIVGVMPPAFVFPGRLNAQVLMPLRLSASERTDARARAFQVIARIPPGATVETTRDRIEAVMARVAAGFPALPPLPAGRRYANPEFLGPFDSASVEPLHDWLSSRPRALFLAVFAAAAALVLLGCVNVSGLMAARSLDRQREIDLRRALGARARHIAALVLAEAGLLAVAGTLLGFALAAPALRLAVGLLPPDLALLKVPAIDWRVAGFAVLATMLSIAGISLWPIRRGLRATGTAAFTDGARGSARMRSPGRFAIVSVQIAIGLALTLGGALFVGSLLRLQQDDIGMDARGVYSVELRIPASVAQVRPGGTEGVLVRVLHGARSIPGVAVAGATDAPLLRNLIWGDLGWKPPAGAKWKFFFNVQGITSGFFEVVRPRLLAGRLPSAEELDAGRPVVVVSQSIAQAFWPDRPAVGQTLEYTLGDAGHFSVIGVVADARFGAWDDDRFKQFYAPLTALRRGSGTPHLLIRTEAPGRLLADLQPFMAAEGADVRAIRAMPLSTMLAETVRPRRFQSWLFGSFAVAALTIVGVGVLGLMAMTAARRTREIGLRMALGATRDGVVRLFVREQLAAVATGMVAGSLVSAWAVPFLRSYLYDLTPFDARVWIAAVLLVAGTATIGSLIPALRASRVDPAKALRVE